MSRSHSKRTKRGMEPESEEEDDDERMPYFVPEDGIDIEPLALYTRGILDEGVKVKVGSHPQNPTQKGFWVISAVAISREDIAAMIEDTRLWNKDRRTNYVNSETAKRRMRIGRAPQGRYKQQTQQQSSRDTVRETVREPAKEPDEDPQYTRQRGSRASVEPDPRAYMPPPAVTRASADNVLDRTRQMPTASPSPRPQSAAPIQQDPRRPSTTSSYPNNPGYIQATAQYTVQAHVPPAQYATYGTDTSMYDPPPQYTTDTKRGPPGGHPGGNQPNATGSAGYQSLYATSSNMQQPRPNQGQRRHGS